MYGVVEPLSGYSFFYEFSHLDGDCFQRFLELLSAELGEDVAVIQFDQGSFHTVKTLDCPENIIPIFQPPHSQATFWDERLGGRSRRTESSVRRTRPVEFFLPQLSREASPQKLAPELNPIERFWEFLKSKLQWENCNTLTQLRHKLGCVLENITPEEIVSLTSYDFILEALFGAAL